MPNHPIDCVLRMLSPNLVRWPLLVLLCGTYAGCQSQPSVELPKTYPATGRVVSKASGPVTTGSVEFISVQDPTVRAIGELQSDGTFTLQTIIQNEMVLGAVSGPHQACVYIRRPESHAPDMARLPQPQVVQEKDNDFTLQIP